jgi:hypothetical protein
VFKFAFSFKKIILGIGVGIIISNVYGAPIIWLTGTKNLRASSVAATYVIGNEGPPTRTFADTIITAYNDQTCQTMIQQIHNTAPDGSSFNADTTIYADAASIYSILNDAGIGASNVHSIQIKPVDTSGDPVLSDNGTDCFIINCLGSTCLGSSSYNVNLNLLNSRL